MTDPCQAGTGGKGGLRDEGDVAGEGGGCGGSDGASAYGETPGCRIEGGEALVSH